MLARSNLGAVSTLISLCKEVGAELKDSPLGVYCVPVF